MKQIISHLMKKVTVVALVLIISIGFVFDATLMADMANAVKPKNSLEYVQVVNPRLYDASPRLDGGAVTAEVKYSNNADANNAVTKAAEKIRDNMIARKKNFTVKIESPRSDYKNLVSEIFQLAISEELATTSNAGDYLAWSYGGYSYSGTAEVNDVAYEYTFNFSVSYYTTAAQEKLVAEAVAKALDSMNIEELGEYDKVQAIYDYVCNVCDYDHSTSNDHIKFTAYGAVINGSAVCQGYTTLLYRLLKEADIDTKIITSTSHAWNIVELEDHYYNVDATWDDSNYEKGLSYKYFLKCNAHFTDHKREAKYTTKAFNNNYVMAEECYYDTHPERKRSANNCENHQLVLSKSVNATCANAGYKLYTCKVCGQKKRVDIKQLAHKTVVKPAVKATYAAAGKTQGSYCSVCKKVIVAQKTVPKLTVPTPKINSVAAKSKGFLLKWGKQAVANGYEVQYSTSNKFTKATTKTETVNKNTTVSKTVSKLKGTKKYYVRVRAYKIYNGKKYYSSWSIVKNVTTKK